MMKNVSNSTKAPDLDMASLNLSTAKGLLEALSDEFDIMEDSVVSYQSNRNEKKCCNLGIRYGSLILYMDGATESNSRIR